MEGVSPLAGAGSIKIPLFLYSGNRDVTVPKMESERFYAAAKAAGRPVKFLEIEVMGHQINRWEPGSTQQILESVSDYLKSDCSFGDL